ncbi:hypothetical protein Tco_1196775 [Tanacetum coccineum]
MMEADFELAQRLQVEEQGEITIEERSRLFVELMNRRKKHGNGYSQKDKNKAKTRQNRARDWKECGKPKPKAHAS